MDLIHELRKSENIYDIMAICYNKIVPYHYSKVANCEFTSYKRISNAIGAYIEEGEGSRNPDMENLINCICNCIINREYKIDDCFFYNIIHQIDSTITYTYIKIGKYFNRYENVGTLNTNAKRVGNIYILPKIQNSLINELEKNSVLYEESHKGLRARSRKEDVSSINYVLHNYVIYQSDKYTPNLKILLDDSRFKNDIMARKSLRIGVIPFSQTPVEELFIIKKQKDTFSIDGPKEGKEQYLYERFKSQLEIIANKHFDIIIFPEMYLTQQIVIDLKALIRDTFKNANSVSDKTTQIIIAGTLWSNMTNKCYIYDNFGNEIFVQNKFTPFEYNNKLEGLIPSNFNINILDIDGIGRIITLICKDITNSDLDLFIKEVRGDIICYPAYSPSLDVTRNTRGITESLNAISVFGNACAPRFKQDSIGYCAVPQRDGTFSSSYIKCYSCDLEECEFHCNPKVLSIHFSKFTEEDGVLKCTIDVEQ